MPGRRQPKIFASPFGTATPNAIYTQQRAKPACQEDINAKFLHLPLAQLPRKQFTRSNAPNPHARKTSTQNFRISYWHSYPERNLHTGTRQTRMPGRHQRKIFASPIGTATPNAIYTQQRAKPECQEDINTKFFISYWHSYPERNLHTATRQTRMPGRHQRKIFASPIGAAAPNTIYTQQRAKPACQEDINTIFFSYWHSYPRTRFRHSNALNRAIPVRYPKIATFLECAQKIATFPQFLILEARIAAEGCPRIQNPRRKSQLSLSF